jgi:hypothetical protein
MSSQDDAIRKAAALIGRKGGRSRSEAKVKAVRENGKKGGRPRKSAQTITDSTTEQPQKQGGGE